LSIHQLHIPIKWRNTKLCSLIVAKCILAIVFLLWLWLVFVGAPRFLVDKITLQAEKKLNAQVEIGSVKLLYHLGGWRAEGVCVTLPYRDELTIEVDFENMSWIGSWLSGIKLNQKGNLKLQKTNFKLSERSNVAKTWQLAKNLDCLVSWDIAQNEFKLDFKRGQILDIICRQVTVSGRINELIKGDTESSNLATKNVTVKQGLPKTKQQQFFEILSIYELYLKKWQLAQKNISLQGQIAITSLKEGRFKAQGILFAQNWIINNEPLFSKGHCEFNLNEQDLVIEKIELHKNKKQLQAHANLNLVSKKVNLHMKSDLGLFNYFDDFFPNKFIWKIKDIDTENIEVTANASWDQLSTLKPTHYDIKGGLSLARGFIDDQYFDSLKAQFHFKDNQGILQDLTLISKDKKSVLTYLRGENQAQYKVESTLNLAWSQILLKPFNFKKYLANFVDTKDSKIKLKAEGLNYLNEHVWQTELDLHAQKIKYLDLHISEFKSAMFFSQDEARYKDTLIALSPSHKESSQPFIENTWHQFCKAEEITSDKNTGIYKIRGLEGQFFPHLLINTLTRSSNDYLSNYQFSNPPYIQFNGRLGGDQDSEWLARVKHDQIAKIKLGKTILPIEQIDVKISRKQQELQISNVAAKIWKGDLTGMVKFHLPNQVKQSKPLSWRANLSAKNMIAASMSEYFNFKSTGEGVLNANLQLYNTSDQLSSLIGNAYVEYKEGSLFSVPIFGPISTILSKMTGNKNMGYQQSTRSNAKLSIANNNIHIQRLDLRTNSFKFEGQGVIGLTSPHQSEIVISTETRGLLNILKYPLTPLTKFLTFKGSGALKEINWGVSPLSNKNYSIEPPVLPSMQEFSLQNQNINL